MIWHRPWIVSPALIVNQLISVSDHGKIVERFKDGNVTGGDYFYDDNGNMIADRNKQIDSIIYNYLNLPVTVRKDSGQYIKYIYNAAGVKLAQEVYNAADVLQKRTVYAGEFIYENDIFNSSTMRKDELS